jgi:hypothetical protein
MAYLSAIQSASQSAESVTSLVQRPAERGTTTTAAAASVRTDGRRHRGTGRFSADDRGFYVPSGRQPLAPSLICRAVRGSGQLDVAPLASLVSLYASLSVYASSAAMEPPSEEAHRNADVGQRACCIAVSGPDALSPALQPSSLVARGAHGRCWTARRQRWSVDGSDRGPSNDRPADQPTS